MAAPTPTSSLVHSSTLVTAGVWLANRFNNILKSEVTKKVIIISAIITTILAGKTAIKEKDIKKIVAISTLSQLGIMIITTSAIIKTLAILHTRTHALFKALLFITVGRMIKKKRRITKKKDSFKTGIKNILRSHKNSDLNPYKYSNNIKIFL